MIDRYPDLPGVRLDDEANPDSGPAIDLGRATPRTASLFVRESGEGVGKSVTINLRPADIAALREGCTRLLVELGVEEYVSVAVPKRTR